MDATECLNDRKLLSKDILVQSLPCEIAKEKAQVANWFPTGHEMAPGESPRAAQKPLYCVHCGCIPESRLFWVIVACALQVLFFEDASGVSFV